MSARSAQTIPLGLLLGVAVIAFLSSPLLLRGDSPPNIPQQIVDRALIAQQNMQQIRVAILNYYYDNAHDFPETPQQLYPDYISDPLVFWHPGDDTPPPTTIDNDNPNWTNSSQCSFRINLEAFDQPRLTNIQRQGTADCNRSAIFIEDLSASNNAGAFRNLLTTGGLETAPYGLIQSENVAVVARRNLTQLLRGLYLYAADNEEWLPLTADHYARGCLVYPEECWHPGDDQPIPRWITNTSLDAPESMQISFTYLGAGKRTTYASDTPMFRDNSPANNEGFGCFTILLGDQIVFEPVCTGDLNGDFRVDVYDLAPLAIYMSPTGSTLPSEGDANGDGFTNFTDLAIVQQHAGETCAP